MKNSIVVYYKNIPVWKKFTLVLLIHIVMFCCVFLTNYYVSSSTIKEKSIDYMMNILVGIKSRTEDKLKEITIISQDIVYDEQIYDVLNSNESAVYSFGYEKEILINDKLKRKLITNDAIKSITILSNYNDVYFAGRERNKNIVSQYIQDEIIQLLDGNSEDIVWYHDNSNDRNNVYMSRIMRNRNSLNQIGVLIVEINLEIFEQICTVEQQEKTNNISMLSSDNVLIYSQNITNQDIHIYEYLSGSQGAFTDKNANQLVAYVAINEVGWKIISTISEKELYSDIYSLAALMLIIVITVILLLIILDIIFSKDFVKSISDIVHSMEILRNKNQFSPLQTGRKDEFGYLNESFNNMAQHLEYLIQCVYREKIMRKEAQIKAMQAQINPHFLFNTLETINWTAQLNGVEEISDMVSDLSSLLEINLREHKKIITFNEEIEYIDKYLSILKKRFKDKIQFEKDVAKETLEMHMPILLVQPLVENAIYHGIGAKKDGGLLKLSAYLSEKEFIIEVYDNGRGIESDKIEILNRNLNSDEYDLLKEENSQKHIGIKNVNARIKLLYGNEFGVTVYSEYGKYFKSVIKLPLEVENNV